MSFLAVRLNNMILILFICIIYKKILIFIFIIIFCRSYEETYKKGMDEINSLSKAHDSKVCILKHLVLYKGLCEAYTPDVFNGVEHFILLSLTSHFSGFKSKTF